MLDPSREAPARDAIAQETRARIEAEGTLKHENAWGLRKLAYEIRQRTEADYRWFRFEAPAQLLEDLGHSLKIADGVLRFRIFKVDAQTPTMAPPAATAAVHGGGRERPSAAPRAAEPAAGAVVAEAPSEQPAGDEGEPAA